MLEGPNFARYSWQLAKNENGRFFQKSCQSATFSFSWLHSIFNFTFSQFCSIIIRICLEWKRLLLFKKLDKTTWSFCRQSTTFLFSWLCSIFNFTFCQLLLEIHDDWLELKMVYFFKKIKLYWLLAYIGRTQLFDLCRSKRILNSHLVSSNWKTIDFC